MQALVVSIERAPSPLEAVILSLLKLPMQRDRWETFNLIGVA